MKISPTPARSVIVEAVMAEGSIDEVKGIPAFGRRHRLFKISLLLRVLRVARVMKYSIMKVLFGYACLPPTVEKYL